MTAEAFKSLSDAAVTRPTPAQFIGGYRSVVMVEGLAGVWSQMGDFGAGNSVARVVGACIIRHSWLCREGLCVRPGRETG